jgi:hypothetical protein
MMRRWILILIAISLHKSYAKEQCQPKTYDLQMAQLCYGGDMGSVESDAKFMNAIYANDNGVNFCYNTLAFLSREGGRTKVEVIHENKEGQLRSNIYNFDSKAVLAADKNVVVLKDLEARCFAINAENDHCSRGFFGLGSSNIPVAITLDMNGDGYKLEGYTKDRGLIEEAKGRGVKATGDYNQKKTAARIRRDIHARLMAKTKELLNAKNAKAAGVTGYRQCMAVFNTWMDKLQKQGAVTVDAFSKEDMALMDKVLDKYNLRGAPLPGDMPTTVEATK